MTEKIAICEQCGHEWKPRVHDPAACPNCKSYEWNKSQIVPEPAA